MSCNCILLLGLLVLAAAPVARSQDLYDEPYRPQIHFTPERNWMNDPNGLVYYDGEYHLFYQYNPFGDQWGHMSWGHAVSTDLLHWKNLDIAIPEAGGVMAFSGSAVVDWNNTSKLGDGEKPPLVAIYTGHHPKGGLQNQNIAFSNDWGRTWTPYKKNPVIDIGSQDFRDPKVSWYAPGGYWVMAVALPGQHKIAFYKSPNLKDGTQTGTFGPAGSTRGVWECPDLFQLPVQGTKDTRWVLIVNVGDAPDTPGSATQYFVGSFDGKAFTADMVGGAVPTRWVDEGRDFYAAVTWSDIPKQDGRRLMIGWLNNWKYGQTVPTHPWRSAQTLIRSLTLVQRDGGPVLAQSPVVEYDKLREPPLSLKDLAIGDSPVPVGRDPHEAYELDLTLDLGSAESVGFDIGAGNGSTRVSYSAKDGVLSVSRSVNSEAPGAVFTAPGFAGTDSIPLKSKGGVLKLHLYLDRASFEIFADEGTVAVTEQFFSAPGNDGLTLFASGGSAKVVDLEMWRLHTIWR